MPDSYTCEHCAFSDVCKLEDPDFDKNDFACDEVEWKVK
jgi:hypothetical protein